MFPDRSFNEFDNSRQQLSQAIAMLGVGIPVWAVHWWLVQRGLREGRSERDAERASSIRAIYFTGVLLISLLVWVVSAIGLLHWLVTDLLDARTDFSYQDPLGFATIGVTAFVVWLYHGLVRRRDLAAGPVSDAAAWVPRMYLYGVAIGGLIAAMAAVEAVITSSLVRPEFEVDDGYTTYFLIERAATGLAWGLVWLGHWLYANRLAADTGWRGTEERVSRTRVAAFVIVIVVAAGSTLSHIATAVGSALVRLLPDPGFEIDPDVMSVVAALVSTVPWAVVWFAHARALHREPTAADPLRALHQERLVTHGVAATALAVGGVGTAWLLGSIIRLVSGAPEAQDFDSSPTYQLLQWLPLAVVGLGAWVWFWRRVVARRHVDPVGEATSTIRRTFLYLTLGVALVVALASAAVILYRFVSEVIGAGFSGSVASELATPLGALAVAVAVLVYHGLALRSDQALAAAQVREDAAVEPGPAPEPGSAAEPDSVPVERRRLELVGPAGADLDAALAALRAALPPGVEIVAEDGALSGPG